MSPSGDLLVEVDPRSPVPPYEQIRGQIATMAASGELPGGTRLPSIRQLAGDLGIATGTVARAYRELESTGVIVSRVRHGSTIVEAPRLSGAEVERALRELAHGYVMHARRLGVTEDRVEAAVLDELGRLARGRARESGPHLSADLEG